MNAYITILVSQQEGRPARRAILASVGRREVLPHAQVCGAIPGRGGAEGSAGHAEGEGVDMRGERSRHADEEQLR